MRGIYCEDVGVSIKLSWFCYLLCGSVNRCTLLDACCFGLSGLAENKCLERRPGGAKLLQIGKQEIALGATFKAAVTLDIQVIPLP